MKQILILRVLGIVLVVVLIVNFTIVMAAPFYMTQPDTTTQLVSSKKLKRRPPGKRPRNRRAPKENPLDLISPDADGPSLDVLPVDPNENPDEVIPTDPDEPDDSNDQQVLDSLNADSGMADGSEGLTIDPEVLFAFGERISQMQNDPIVTRQVANAAKQLTRWQTPAAARTDTGDPDSVDSTEDPADQLINDVFDEPFDSESPLSSSQIVLRNATNYPVAFELGGRVLRLEAGAELVETADELLLRFDRGGDFGEHRTSVLPGIYEFAVSKDGWSVEEQTVLLR